MLDLIWVTHPDLATKTIQTSTNVHFIMPETQRQHAWVVGGGGAVQRSPANKHTFPSTPSARAIDIMPGSPFAKALLAHAPRVLEGPTPEDVQRQCVDLYRCAIPPFQNCVCIRALPLLQTMHIFPVSSSLGFAAVVRI